MCAVKHKNTCFLCLRSALSVSTHTAGLFNTKSYYMKIGVLCFSFLETICFKPNGGVQTKTYFPIILIVS